jgi:hypothetical protein
VKLYVEEEGSEAVVAAVARAESACTVRVSYVETRSSSGRRAESD